MPRQSASPLSPRTGMTQRGARRRLHCSKSGQNSFTSSKVLWCATCAYALTVVPISTFLFLDAPLSHDSRLVPCRRHGLPRQKPSRVGRGDRKIGSAPFTRITSEVAKAFCLVGEAPESVDCIS